MGTDPSQDDRGGSGRRRAWHCVEVACLVLAIAACGGGGGDTGGGGNPAPPPVAVTPGFVQLNSDAGDYIGGGKSYRYSGAVARVSVTVQAGLLSVVVTGDESWTGQFQMPSSASQLLPGSYSGLERYPFHNAARGGLAWYGEGRACNVLAGSFTIDKATYTNDVLSAVDLRFEQRCEGGAPTLRGEIHWFAGDTSRPSGPAAEVPAVLWRASSDSVPSAGNYVYLESQNGDYIGAGRVHLYSPTTALIAASTGSGRVTFDVNGDERWGGDFQAMDGVAKLRPGHYANLRRYPFHNPALGGMSWSGDGRGCNTLTGWFVVDSVTYNGNELASLDLRFEQHCEGVSPALRGQIHWRADDTTPAAAPVKPAPAGLWRAPAETVPAAGTYLYLQSDVGDYIGQGRTRSFSGLNARFSATSEGGNLIISVNGDSVWSGRLGTMSTLSSLQQGYYGDVRRYPFHNPVKGGMDWSGEARGCNTLTGWFVIDAVTYTAGQLTAVELRFEQHCEAAAGALRGQLRWSANDSTPAPGPVNPPPADLWVPAAGVTPATGNYVYLQSAPGDYIGAGLTHLYTQASALLTAQVVGGQAVFAVQGNETWNGTFAAMDSLSALQPGYFGGLRRHPLHNPVFGGLDWHGDGRGCNELTGWFVVDSITRNNGALETIELRFEQYCDGSAIPLRGKLRWSNADSAKPPGPVTPPADLWQPEAGATPASGNYVYLQSTPGDYIGLGSSYLYTRANAVLTTSSTGATLDMAVQGDQRWNGTFQAMSSLATLQPGFYANLQRFPFHNPATGGFAWGGEGRGCNELGGWVAIDQINVVNEALTMIELRFQQNCEGAGAPLRGKVRWSSADATSPPGPVSPPPADLWRAAAGATPASGNYVYLESSSGDTIGRGQTYLYRGADATMRMSSNGPRIHLDVNTDWSGDFQGMNTLQQLQPGYFGDLARYPFHNPVKGGLSWSGQTRGCNQVQGWFVIDTIEYTDGLVSAVELRFEQQCDGDAGKLRGQVRWGGSGSRIARGPVRPNGPGALMGSNGQALSGR